MSNESEGKASDREQAITDLVNQEILADGRDALQRLDRKDRNSGGGGNYRGGSTNDLDNTP